MTREELVAAFSAKATAVNAVVQEMPTMAAALQYVVDVCADKAPAELLADEPGTAEALARWGAVKRIVVPRVEGDVMRFYEYDPQTLCPGAFGIAEPGPAARLCDPSEIDLVIVPGTAFTASGIRCGRGRGYYDKYLSLPGVHAVKVGVCFAHQLVGELPAEPHDVAMDYVITD